ncbi:RecX family transcriptional regulator [Sedimentibacter sp. zth1]|uniref:RecX family transcriptional regulator n=1 Tax=Sedimentibacter sp. zth1 TaxID=2816908 RepID=UPI001A9361BA|nr:RecX family transcriptional regulator [Sedimentibacter sp. zth1]QSX05036.1 RecX family transcriptional regulator [Sedimentibacter sp. zth1]
MKTITSIEYQKKNNKRVSVFLDNKFAFGLDLEIYLKYNLSKGVKLDDEFIEKILKAEDFSKALNYSIALLTRKDRTEKEIITKLLEKDYEKNIIDNVITKLKEYNYINDTIYCEKYINDKLKFSKNGINKIKNGLYQKGVDKGIISQKISMIDKEQEYERALAIAEKKIKTYKEMEMIKIKSKLFRFLVSKGYDFDVANKVISQLIKR